MRMYARKASKRQFIRTFCGLCHMHDRFEHRLATKKAFALQSARRQRDLDGMESLQ
jgi:hypothetical protein